MRGWEGDDRGQIMLMLSIVDEVFVLILTNVIIVDHNDWSTLLDFSLEFLEVLLLGRN